MRAVRDGSIYQLNAPMPRSGFVLGLPAADHRDCTHKICLPIMFQVWISESDELYLARALPYGSGRPTNTVLTLSRTLVDSPSETDLQNSRRVWARAWISSRADWGCA